MAAWISAGREMRDAAISIACSVESVQVFGRSTDPQYLSSTGAPVSRGRVVTTGFPAAVVGGSRSLS